MHSGYQAMALHHTVAKLSDNFYSKLVDPTILIRYNNLKHNQEFYDISV